MKNPTPWYLQLPEYVLMLSVLFYWYSTALLLNPVAILLMAVLILQLIFKNQVVGIIIPSLMALATSFLFLALISEFNEFESFTSDAALLLFVGLAFLGITALASLGMLYKYTLFSTQQARS
ncbi:MAG: hypothetical protein ACPGED_01325 [Flavobacteriales bacterium]